MDDSVPRVCLLGGFSVATEDGVVEERAWRLRKAKALVKLLALAPERRLHRERLAELLWPDRDADAAANNLHQALHAARRAIGADGPAPERRRRRPRGRGRRRRLRGRRRPRARDRRARRLRGRARPPRRRAAARGPLRAVGRRAARGAARAPRRPVLELAELSGDDAQAVAALQRALVVDPLAEPAHRALMRAVRGDRPPPAGARAVPAAAPAAATPSWRPSPTPRPARSTASCSRARAGRRRRAATSPQPLTSLRRPRARARRDRRACSAATRLLTLIGPGGCGKTRLAIETLAGGSSRVPDGVWFVELAGLTDGALVAQATALAVGVPIPAQRSAQEALAAHLAEPAGASLVLDNCEHVDRRVRAPGRGTCCAPCPGCACWPPAASRCAAAARSPGACPPLAPRLSRPVRRARRAPTRAFEPAPSATQPPIEEICRRLDGMPLAIELAAARVAALSPDQIAARLGDSFDVLAAGSRTALHAPADAARHASTGATTCSTGEERVLFRRLAVFAGGFTSRPPRTCAPAAPSRGASLDLLARLVDKSLVRSTGPRYRLLDTIRQFAAERLDAAAEHDTRACATSTGAWPWPRSTTRCPPARGARCARSRPSTTTSAPA